MRRAAKGAKRGAVFLVLLVAFFLLFSFLLPQTGEWRLRLLLGPLLRLPEAVVVYDREGLLLSALPATDGQWRFPAENPSAASLRKSGDRLPGGEGPLLQTAGWLRFEKALLAFEDRRFRFHPGIDPPALLRAFRQNRRAGRIRGGGSTLTQQLARMARAARHPGKTYPRSYGNKAAEAFLALSLEAFLTKDEILALYAAHAPFGGNVAGLEAAAWRYFGKPPAEISLSEAALLAVLPNAPALLHPGRNRDKLLRKRNRLLEQLSEQGALDSLELALAKAEEIPPAPRPLPHLAPHLLFRWKARDLGVEKAGVEKTGLGKTGLGKAGVEKVGLEKTSLRSSIDRPLQEGLEALARDYHPLLSANEVEGLAVAVVETTPRGVFLRALVGNAAYPVRRASGYVDASAAPRSTGSILKPFLYALLLDQGSLLPGQWLEDLPTRFGDFRPENADLGYDGYVRADEALLRSLNIPFVRALADFGVEPFQAFLQRAGLRHLFRSPEEYGLSLILGGGEATLLETVTLYAALARGGRFAPLSLMADGMPSISGKTADGRPRGTPSDAAPPPDPVLLSEEAAYLTLETLRRLERPEEEAPLQALAEARPIAWKTGTSFGQRDAWAVGVTPRYTVGVWAGNPGGEGRPGLWGGRAAGPLLFRVFSLLPPSEESPWFPPPPGLVSFSVCPLTGYRAAPACPAADTVRAPASARLAPLCPFHARMAVDASSLRVHAGCEPSQNLRLASYLDLPPAAGSFYAQGHGRHDLAPPWRADCREEGGTRAIEILYPRNGARLSAMTGLDGRRQKIVFEARHRLPAAGLRWFLNGKDLGRTTDFHTVAVHPERGANRLLVVDEDGDRDEVVFQLD